MPTKLNNALIAHDSIQANQPKRQKYGKKHSARKRSGLMIQLPSQHTPTKWLQWLTPSLTCETVDLMFSQSIAQRWFFQRQVDQQNTGWDRGGSFWSVARPGTQQPSSSACLSHSDRRQGLPCRQHILHARVSEWESEWASEWAGEWPSK